jgi:hypothetical protein
LPRASWSALRRHRVWTGRDIVGRKYTFLVTILIMGLSTFIVSLPNAATIGTRWHRHSDCVAPAAGPRARWEYAVRRLRRGTLAAGQARLPSFIQTTATLGLFLSLLVILYPPRSAKDAEWGWRIRSWCRCFCSAFPSGSGCA